MMGMPRGCEANQKGYLECPCKEESIEDDFPSISISFETMATFRILGLDSGADTVMCIPPRAYVEQQTDKPGRCSLLVADGGETHKMFAAEAVVLGIPFFRSVNVLLDLENDVVGVEAIALPPRPQSSGTVDLSQGDCKCADPKWWWNTGKRFSPKRVVLALFLVSLVAGYIFVGFSRTRTAERMRALLDGLVGSLPLAGRGGQSLGDDSGSRPDSQFLEMSNQGRE